MAFPTTGTLDDFNRANEQPVGGGWNATPIYNPGIATLQIVANQLTRDAGGISGQYWNTQFGPDMECYATLAADPQPIHILYVRAQNVGTTSLDGYVLTVFSDGSRRIRVSRETDGSDTLLDSFSESGAFSAGDKIGISVVGSTITGYWNLGGAGWVQKVQATDTTYIGNGYIGVVIESGAGTMGLDDFGGGTVIPRDDTVYFQPPIFRSRGG